MFKEYFDMLLSVDASPIDGRVWIMFCRIAEYLSAKSALEKMKLKFAGKYFRLGNLGEYQAIFGEKCGLPALTNKRIIVRDAQSKHGLGMFVQEVDKISPFELPDEFKADDNILAFFLIP